MMMMVMMMKMMVMVMMILISSWNPKRNPSFYMVNCFMGADDFDIFLNPYKKPYKKP